MPFYITALRENLQKRQMRSKSYSLRAFARDLNIHPATLSLVMNGKRKLPLKDASRLAEKLTLTPKEQTLFVESLMSKKVNLDMIKIDDVDDRFMLDDSYFSVISEWQHCAILDLLDLTDFDPTVENIAHKLAITEDSILMAIHNLEVSGLGELIGNRFVKAFREVRTTEDVQSRALKQSHIQTLEIGKQKLEEVELDQRDFSSTTFAVDPEKIPEAKIIIREFRKKMASLMKSGHKTEVYQLAIQLYPLTQQQKEL